MFQLLFSFRVEGGALPPNDMLFAAVDSIIKSTRAYDYQIMQNFMEKVVPMCQLKSGLYFSLTGTDTETKEFKGRFNIDDQIVCYDGMDISFLDKNFARITIYVEGISFKYLMN